MSKNTSYPRSALACAAMLAAALAHLPAQAASGGTLARAGNPAPALTVIPTPNLASDLVVNVAGISSFDEVGAAINTVLTVNALPGAVVDQVSWNLTLRTIGLSWLTEATVLITNSNGDGIYFSPGAGDDFSGTETYIGGGSLVSLGLSFNVLADGRLYFEFFEDYDDYSGAVDANYLSGSITLGGIGAAVPEPSSYGLMGLGLLGLALARRRR